MSNEPIRVKWGCPKCGADAKFVSAGHDPVKTLVQLASVAGWDVDPQDVEWAEDAELSVDEA